MAFETDPVDRVLHLLIFVAAAGLLGVLALGALERLVDGTSRVVRTRVALVPAALLALLVTVERLYHLVA